jgi:hypothetical protein
MDRTATSSIIRWLVCVAVGALLPGCPADPIPIWVESQEHIELSAADVDKLVAVTHNGRIVVAAKDGSETIIVDAKKRAGGWTEAQAAECMEALEIITEKAGRVQKLGWKLDRPKPNNWSVEVAFEVTVPPRLAVSAKSHNGRIEVTGVRGDCELETHNGGVTARTESKELLAETHNGAIKAASPASRVSLVTHNGPVEADLNAEGDLAGTVRTHNGRIALQLGERAATNLKCSTYNGSIRCSRDLKEATVTRSYVTGKIGESAAALELKTHNGSITVE